MPNEVSQIKISPECKTALQYLQTVFGHQEFRPGQKEAIECILSGEDTVVIIPTGGGKTAIYTLPCIMTPGLAFVVSPLIMLMSDQVARLQQCGINTCYYNTMLTDNERQHILHNLKQPDCQYQFLFISPEAIVTEQLKHCLNIISRENRLSLFIIDEAHCISTWGKEFRPAYLQLGTLRTYNVPIVALTGTATTETLDAIKETLQMDKPKVVKMPCRRENLIYSIVGKDNKAKEQVSKIIEDDFADACGIVYCGTQADTVEMAFILKEHVVTATYYHAGMEGGQRMLNASLWLENKVKVICCTDAFGMGIDKKDVRFVIHLTLPSSLEDYVQESGRGGRDGQRCDCILLFRFGDRLFHLKNISRLSSEQLRNEKYVLLNAITSFCMEHSICRMQLIAKYFSEMQGDECKVCDVCQKGMTNQIKDFTNEAKSMHCGMPDKYDCNIEQSEGQCTGNDIHGFQGKRHSW